MIRSVRGMRDVLPEEARRWRDVEDRMRQVLESHAYEEVHLPLLEDTELFARGVGEATDIVEKEMYSLADRDGDGSLSLRPEGTASCVRALNENGLLFNQTQRVFYAGPMFRYERPQKGRYRQFYQVGAEAFGFAGPDVDAELIALGAAFWRDLGVASEVRLEINTLGAASARQAYRSALVEYLTPLKGELDEDSQRRLVTNPMRILDSKSEATQRLLADAPRLHQYVDDESLAHFEALQALLSAMGIEFQVNERLVRGLDYYTRTVFEWITDRLGSQGTVCAGGRYDGLVEQLGGKSTPAAGFAAGLDRVALLHEEVHQNVRRAVDVYICIQSPDCFVPVSELAAGLRRDLPALRIRTHMGGGALKKQLKKADQSGARWALLIGEQELQERSATLKRLSDGHQETVAFERLAASLQD